MSETDSPGEPCFPDVMPETDSTGEPSLPVVMT